VGSVLFLMFAGNPVVTGTAVAAVGFVVLATLVTLLLPGWFAVRVLIRRAASRLRRPRKG
jgi:hypothetical protein